MNCDLSILADDSQLYVFVKPVQANVDGAIGRLEKCCHDIRTWMRRNFLKLNDDKTEVLLIGSRQQLSKIALPGVTVGESSIAPATSVGDLGAVFHTHMTMVQHVNALSQSARYHIRNIGKIRRFLDCDSCEKIVHAFVTSRLDLNNALLAGLRGDTVATLQKCQNIATRVVTRSLQPFRLGRKDWSRGTVVKRLDERSYVVDTPTGVLRRNRQHPKKTHERYEHQQAAVIPGPQILPGAREITPATERPAQPASNNVPPGSPMRQPSATTQSPERSDATTRSGRAIRLSAKYRE